MSKVCASLVYFLLFFSLYEVKFVIIYQTIHSVPNGFTVCRVDCIFYGLSKRYSNTSSLGFPLPDCVVKMV